MTITILPATKLGKLLHKWGWLKANIIEVTNTPTGIHVKSNKNNLHEITLSVDEWPKIFARPQLSDKTPIRVI